MSEENINPSIDVSKFITPRTTQESQYIEMLDNITVKGYSHDDRTGVGRRTVIGKTMVFDLSKEFPLFTCREINFEHVVHELLWFIRGSNNVKELTDVGVKFWNKWKVTEESVIEYMHDRKINHDEDYYELDDFKDILNTIGPMYGHVWRNTPIVGENKSSYNEYPLIKFEDLPKDKLETYKRLYEESLVMHPGITFERFAVERYYDSVDQLNELLIALRDNPYSSRLILEAWIPGLLPFEKLSPERNVIIGRGALAPCHKTFQCFVEPGKNGNKNKLHTTMYQRSCDSVVGVPVNIASYALLTHMIAHVTNMDVGEFTWFGGDIHTYTNQEEVIDILLGVQLKPLPTLIINPEVKSIYDFKLDDFKIEGYFPNEPLKVKVAK